MATLETLTTRSAPIGVTYPAEHPDNPTAIVRCRVGKSTVVSKYTDDMLCHLVQFRHAGSITMFLLSDILQASYLKRIRNAYDVFGQLDIDKGVKLSRGETGRVVQWLAEYSQALGACSRD
jgi:hypothetical protein